MEKHRRTGSRESLPLDSSRNLSPLRRKSIPIEAPTSRKPRPPSSSDELPTAPTRGLWPSSSSFRRSGTLADHLGNDRLSDLAHRRPPPSHTPPEPPISISRQRSSSEFRRLDEERSSRDELEHDKEDRKIKKKSSKENHRPIGGSMRYIGNKLLFPRSSSKPDSPPSSTSSVPTAARISVDENALASSRRKSDFLLDIPSFESERSDNSNRIPNPRAPRPNRNIYHHNDDKNQESKSAEMNPTMKLAPPAIRRTSSGSAWALSAGRRSGSPPLVDGNARPAAAGLRSFSNLRPQSPGKGKGGGGSVGNILSLGLDLFRKKSGSPTLTPTSSFGNGSPGMAAGEAGHHFKMAHNRLMQWRFVNARSDASRRAKGAVAQSVLIGAWAALSKLQTSVAQKQLQLHKEKLGLKINTILSYQVKLLNRWNDSDRQHAAALSTTRDSLQSVVCRLPLIEGAKVDPQILSAALRQTNDLTSTIKTTVGIFSPMVEKTVPLLSELAQVVSEEKSLLEEGSEVLSLISSFQLQEESLKCHLIQLNSVRSIEHLQARNAITTA
ncbi:hypothetical protein J5N97_011970 [Dioscorea zingiberensis]|uniref:QWRF motif-containing protein 3 n=1 Tax=Dioscorea zingiberensis TaxID=325984 RepID=A0A9D5HNV0_9LILI|nr:hypothetical protein J5N97_011970 [Dioscorea zingiberensis]